MNPISHSACNERIEIVFRIRRYRDGMKKISYSEDETTGYYLH